jgi:hypothetical protein
MSHTLRRLAAVALPAAVLFAGAAVLPGATASAKTLAHYATFQGEVDRGGRSGTAGDNPGTPTIENGTCTDAGSGVTNTSCSVSFTLSRSICEVHPGELVLGHGTYTTSTNESFSVPLRGAGEFGSGVLEGHLAVYEVDGGAYAVHLWIDAGDFCGALMLAEDLGVMSQTRLSSDVRTGGFNGHVDMIGL